MEDDIDQFGRRHVPIRTTKLLVKCVGCGLHFWAVADTLCPACKPAERI